MHAAEVTKGIFRLSANVYDDILFEGLWPLPYGISMNSYIVKGDKCAIIDGVCGWDGVPETLTRELGGIGVKPENIDVVVLNHLEPDHTGWLASFKDLNDHFTLYTSRKGAELVHAFYGITDRIQTVESGDTVNLGAGKVLHFEEIPNVHWPETIATFESDTGTLFSCDAFGSFGAVTEAPFDDQLEEEDILFFEREALRYYSNIVGAFSSSVLRAIEKLSPLDIRIVAPAHGVVWRRNPERIIELYRSFANWSTEPEHPEITVIWGSMYGNTEKALTPLLEGIESEGVKTHVHRVPETHVSFILESAYRSRGIVLAMPTYEYHMFPPMASVLEDLGRKKVLNRKGFRFGSFGWSGGAQKELHDIQHRLKMQWEFLEPIEFPENPEPEIT